MKVSVSLASIITCLAVHAQVAGTLNRLPDGQDEVRIRNNSSGQLVAFAAPQSRCLGKLPAVRRRS